MTKSWLRDDPVDAAKSASQAEAASIEVNIKKMMNKLSIADQTLLRDALEGSHHDRALIAISRSLAERIRK